MSWTHPLRCWPVGVVLVVGALGSLHRATFAGVRSVALTPAKDNTLIENPTGSVSGATSLAVYAGRATMAAAGPRRGVVQFDVASALPPTATVVAATLDVTCVLSNTGVQSVSLHRTLEAWGEGTSFGIGPAGGPATPGDATWLHTFWPDTLWSTAGGSFAAAPSATTTVGVPGPYQWGSTPGLVADVQSWIDEPSANHGWIILGNERVPQTLKGFASREASEAQRPVLTIEYTLDPADLDGDGLVGGADLGLLLSGWGPCSAPPLFCTGDLDGNGAVDGGDLGMVLAAWTP